MQLMLECEISVDKVQRLERLLKTESGLNVITSVDQEVKSEYKSYST